MKAKIFLARGMSRLFFAILYILDIFIIYCITGDILYTVIGAAAILVSLAIQMGISLIALKAHSLRNATSSDASYLQSCMDEVMRRSTSVGRKHKIHLWIADNESLNCYTVGNNIVVNKSLLRLGDSSMIEACLAHELSHVLNCDWYFSALMTLNIFVTMCSLSLFLFGMGVALVLIMVILFSIIFSAWAGFAVGTMIGKVLKFFSKLITSIFYYTTKAFSAFLCRRQEFEADRYAAILGYSFAIINIIHLIEQHERHSIQTSWIEELLNDHPSAYRRIAHIERLEAKLSEIEHINQNRNVILYENPFD